VDALSPPLLRRRAERSPKKELGIKPSAPASSAASEPSPLLQRR